MPSGIKEVVRLGQCFSGIAMHAIIVRLFSSLVLLGMLSCGQAVETPRIPPGYKPHIEAVETPRISPGYKPHIKVVDGYLYVVHAPCPPTPVDPQSAITLTNLYDGSIMFLNRDGSINTRKRHGFKTEEGRTRLHKALGDRSTVRLIVIPPECPKQKCESDVWQIDGWPDPHAIDIGDPPMPKVGLRWHPASSCQRIFLGWRGSHCWPMGDGTRECDETPSWEGLAEAEPFILVRGSKNIYLPVLGDEANPGRIERLQVYSILEEKPALKLGEEILSTDAREGETIERFVPPDWPEGVYLLVISYESQLGEISYGFKVRLLSKATD